ncbi:hypothetical protein GWI33_008699 [Rhynchophorus ferrugineus]|uniref:VWFC domain-containing protein n=1 Tax=Rhynchophorus ferrugineus TaxID=354439 RepID=A0A834MFR9_RHYFE|nr:hypothetical protein GWI33_008699 [Rhynchophorus ferrugineus]
METFSYVFAFSMFWLASAQNCDNKGILIYKDIECKPVTENGGCPTSFDCDFARPRSGCLFKGKVYNEREKIPYDLTYSSCNAGCYCRGSSILCAVLDCPEFLRIAHPGCYNKYELGKCCAVGNICGGEASSKKCQVEGKAYKAGQRFYPNDRCLDCVCHENFDGTYDEKTCKTRNCASELYNADKIRERCAPAYLKFDKGDSALCCPNEWICPEPTDRFEIIKQENSTGSCYFGSKIVPVGHGFKKEIYKYDAQWKIVCECSVPPLLTCKEL